MTTPAPTEQTRYDPRWKGEWLAFPLTRATRRQRRPHFFPEGDERSFCEIVTKLDGMLLYDPERWITLQSDPMIDRIREHIRPCRLCEMLLERPTTTAELVAQYQIVWTQR